MRLFFLILIFSISSLKASLPVDTVVKRVCLDRDVLTVGIISDAQFPERDEDLSVGHFGVVMNGPKHIYKALNYFKEQSVDMIIMNGDMVNSPSGCNAYNTYNMIFDEVYGKLREEQPLLMYTMGNHEYYTDNAEELFKKNVGLPLNYHYVLNGIHFIGISCSDASGGYSDERLEYLKWHLKLASKEDKKNPIILISHMPFNIDGFFGGQWDSPQSEEFYKILASYPQVVYFCGHSHYPLFDDFSVIQKDFTIVNTGSTSYFDLDWNTVENGVKLDGNLPNEYENPELIGIYKQSDIEGRDNVNHGWIMNLNTVNGEVVLKRMNFNLLRKFGDVISLSNLYKKNFNYTRYNLERKAKQPFFDKGSYVNCFVEDDGVVDICFDAASTDVLVKYYMIIITDPDGRKEQIRFLAKGYYQGFDLPYMEHVRYNGSRKKGMYRVEIKAVSCFGKESDFLLSDYTLN